MHEISLASAQIRVVFGMRVVTLAAGILNVREVAVKRVLPIAVTELASRRTNFQCIEVFYSCLNTCSCSMAERELYLVMHFTLKSFPKLANWIDFPLLGLERLVQLEGHFHPQARKGKGQIPLLGLTVQELSR